MVLAVGPKGIRAGRIGLGEALCGYRVAAGNVVWGTPVVKVNGAPRLGAGKRVGMEVGTIGVYGAEDAEGAGVGAG